MGLEKVSEHFVDGRKNSKHRVEIQKVGALSRDLQTCVLPLGSLCPHDVRRFDVRKE